MRFLLAAGTLVMSLTALLLLPHATADDDSASTAAAAINTTTFWQEEEEHLNRRNSTCDDSAYPPCKHQDRCAGAKSNCCYDSGTCKDTSAINCRTISKKKQKRGGHPLFPKPYGPYTFHFNKTFHQDDGWYCATTDSSLPKPNPSPNCVYVAGSTSAKYCWGTLICDHKKPNASCATTSHAKCWSEEEGEGGYAKEGSLCIYEEDGESFSFCGKKKYDDRHHHHHHEKPKEEKGEHKEHHRKKGKKHHHHEEEEEEKKEKEYKEEEEEEQRHEVHKKKKHHHHKEQEEEAEEEDHKRKHHHHEKEEEECEEEEEDEEKKTDKRHVHHHHQKHRHHRNEDLDELESAFENAFEAGFKWADKLSDFMIINHGEDEKERKRKDKKGRKRA